MRKKPKYAVVYTRYMLMDSLRCCEVFEKQDDAARFAASVSEAKVFGLNPEYQVDYTMRVKP